jgi:predicted dinucleotide-binding enzyme
MQIGLIGAGNVGKTIARHLITAGHKVVISNSRGPESLEGAVGELGPSARAATKEEAVQSHLVILCVHWFPMLTWPSAQARRAKIRGIGYGVRSDFELNFGRYLPALGRADEDHTDTQPH